MLIRQPTKEEYVKIASMERLYMALPWSIDTIEIAILFGSVFFVTDDISGYGSIKIIEKEAEINNICVDQNYRRQGIASSILKDMLGFAKSNGVTKVFLEVDENNKGAIVLYAKFGFVPLYTRPNYYGNVGAIVMELDLSNSIV